MTGERLVGYQTRRESCFRILLNNVNNTTGIFFRSLIENDLCMKGFIHIIIDLVHERDRFTDVLMGVLHIRLLQYTDLKVILLGPNRAHLHSLSQYVRQRNVIDIVAGTNAPLDYFLEDILMNIQFTSRSDNGTPVGPWRTFDRLVAEAWFKGSDGVFGQS